MTSELWSKEYSAKGIPSSFRTEATKVVARFVSFLTDRKITRGKALDLGCGKGRNAFYLAQSGFEVCCVDWVEDNVSGINQMAKEGNLALQAYCQSVADPWPFVKDACDVAIDIFCYKHITDKRRQAQYRKNLTSALKKGGYYLISLAADDDGFYGPLLKQSPDISRKLVIDPYSNIGSLLYNSGELIEEFSGAFIPVAVENARSVSPMHGKEYPRSVLNVVFQKH